MKTETNTNKAGYVVVRHVVVNEKEKTVPVSPPLATASAAEQCAELCRKQGWTVSIVAKGRE